MITRIWHEQLVPKMPNAYLHFLEESGITDYRKTPGDLSIKILRKQEPDICHFWTVTEWDNIESIKAFAGDDLEMARYYTKNKEFLLEFEEKVIHCETFSF